ncbi:MAG: protein kinase domain-containing protein, partial [Candidatus Binatia bacterium]
MIIAFPPGTIISKKYEVLELLGVGGMAAVYKVRQRRFSLVRAMKVLSVESAASPEMVDRFNGEAEVMAKLSADKKHPHIVEVIDTDHDENLNCHYIIMEYIQGKTLRSVLDERMKKKQRGLPLSEVVEITSQVASALAYMHGQQPSIIHRDIKPSNIMLANLPGQPGLQRAVVMDLGIAKELGMGDRTQFGESPMTPKYASPEQADPTLSLLDGRTDIYSLGLVMFEMCESNLFMSHPREENDPTFHSNPSPEFIRVVRKAICKSRERRYQRMEDLLQDLKACQGALQKSTLHVRPQETEDTTEVLDEGERIQRERAVTLRGWVEKARERATREGAEEWAAALFQQGIDQEQQGKERFGERDYLSAQSAYQEAVSLFDRAGAEARAAAKAAFDKAEQARQEMYAIKAEAEQGGARERARTFYAQGLALQAQADELWERKNYQQAGQAYTEAWKSFADARELAQETRRQEAQEAYKQAIAAKEAAEREGASELAPAVFREAVENEQRANTAREHEAFTQARDLYDSAQHKYQLARQQAQVERQRQHVLGLQQWGQEARRQAEAIHALEYAPDTYQRAAAAWGRGDAQFQEQQYEQAAREYEQAQQDFAQAAHEAEQELRRQIELAQGQIQEARVRAQQAGAAERFGKEFAQAQRLVEQGQEEAQQQNLVQVLRSCEQAAQQFSQLHQKAVQEEREQAEAARQRVSLLREQVSPLQQWAEKHWTEARQWETQAEDEQHTGLYTRAIESYEHACQVYERARTAAQARLRQEAVQVRQQAEAAKVTAQQEGAERHAAARFAEGAAV